MNIPSPSLNGLGTLIFPENIFWPKPVHQFSRSPGLQEKPGQIRQQKKKKKKISFLKIFACCSGDSVDKILQEAPGAWRGDSEWGRVFWKNQGFTGLCEQVIMYEKAGQFSELWVYLNFETHSRVGETHCLSTLNISSSLKFSAPSGRVVKK